MSKFVVGVSTLLVGLAVGYFLSGGKNNSTEEVSPAEDQPLYWVAPMDANYKRDKPGLSPMGMDLVPVYPEDLSGGGSPGTVSISPEVVNNLGVRTESVLFSPLQGIIKTVGYVSFDQEKMVDVHSRIAGWVESVSIYEEGEYVEKGQLLYEMYSPELVNAQEEYLVARKNGNRYLSQASQGKLQALGVPAVFIEQLKKQRKAMDRVPVYAMHSGYVSQLNVRQGMYIKPTTKLLSLGSLDEVWVTADIFERQANLVSVGDQVEMTLDYLPGQNWLGNVDYIYPSLDDKTRSLQVRIRFDNPDLSLKPDMFARLALRTQATEPMLNVPSSSVIVTGSQTRVVVALGEGRYKSVEVKTGPRFADRTAILEGVLPEDWVVTSAQFLLDSESSISSDFLRMTPPSVGLIDEVWTQAQIREVNTDRRLVVLEHGAIREWKQSSMVMEVPASDTLDLSFLAEGSVIQVLLKGANMSELQLTDYILPRPKAPGSLPGADL
jgi:Cu(I)/Ag(I) efflux system membrane fusion protein